MIPLDNLNKFLDQYMHYDPKVNVSKIDEKNANGLQYKGIDKIKKIAFGVSASLEIFKLADKSGCQVVIVHHGVRLPDNPHYDIAFYSRIGCLIENNISLFGYHFLLDSHPKIGHNTLILNKLGVINLKQYEIQDANWGWYGELKRSENLELIIKKCKKLFQNKITVYNFGNKKVKTIAAISGGGSPHGIDLQNVADRNIDLYITGEPREGIRELFREIKKNFIAGGHYATEVIGVKALMEKVKEHFKDKVEVEFIDLWNEV